MVQERERERVRKRDRDREREREPEENRMYMCEVEKENWWGRGAEMVQGEVVERKEM